MIFIIFFRHLYKFKLIKFGCCAIGGSDDSNNTSLIIGMNCLLHMCVCVHELEDELMLVFMSRPFCWRGSCIRLVLGMLCLQH